MTDTRCPTCGRKAQRSNPQNKRYWELMHLLSESLKTENGKYSADIWHEYCKSRYIGVEEIQLPSGEILKKPLSSAELDKEQFNIYMTQVEVFAAENGIYLAD